MGRLLSDEAHRRVAAAIETAERRTSGEIYCVAQNLASDYRVVPLAWGTAAALFLPVVLLVSGLDLHRLPLLGDPWFAAVTEADVASLTRRAVVAVAAAQTLLFVLVVALLWPIAIRLRFTPRGLKRDRTLRAATEQFLAHNLHRTRARTGVLIYVALAEHQVHVIADEGIHAKVDQAVWDDAVAALTARARAGRLEDGFLEAIGICADVLAAHVPPGRRNDDELPNRVAEI